MEIKRVRLFLIFVAILSSSGCASHGPVLYPNDHWKRVREETAKRDIQDCERQAAEYVKSEAALDF